MAHQSSNTNSIQGVSSPDTSTAFDFWTPPDTDESTLFRLWRQVRTANHDAWRELTHTPSEWIYPWSVSSQGEIRISNLDPYGITISDEIRCADHDFASTPQNEACEAVLVKEKEVAEFVGDIREVWDRYRSHNMFVDLVQQKLVLPTPLRYSTFDVERQWRPERSLDLGGELVGVDWRFPPLLKLNSVSQSVGDHETGNAEGNIVSVGTELGSEDVSDVSPWTEDGVDSGGLTDEADTLLRYADDGSRYLTHAPFQTEHYHLLSKRTDPPYNLAIQIPSHPKLYNFLPLEARGPETRTPWHIPSASYWLRPVGFPSGHIFGARPPPPVQPKQDKTADTEETPPQPSPKFFYLSMLNNITMPYFSIEYIDNNIEYDNAATNRLAVAMGTCLYNRFLLHEKAETFRHQNHVDRSPEQSGRSECSDHSESASHRDYDMKNVQDFKNIKHYGLTIGMEYFYCWVAEPNLTLGPVGRDNPITTDHDKETGAEDHISHPLHAAFPNWELSCKEVQPSTEEIPEPIASHPNPSIKSGNQPPKPISTNIATTNCTGSGSSSSAPSTSTTAVILTPAHHDEFPRSPSLPTNGTTSEDAVQSKLTWNGCTIHKVLDGEVTSFADVARLAEFINNVHTWGMGGYLDDVKNDIQDICGTDGYEEEGSHVADEPWTDTSTANMEGWGCDASWESDDIVEGGYLEKW